MSRRNLTHAEFLELSEYLAKKCDRYRKYLTYLGRRARYLKRRIKPIAENCQCYEDSRIYELISQVQEDLRATEQEFCRLSLDWIAGKLYFLV